LERPKIINIWIQNSKNIRTK